MYIVILLYNKAGPGRGRPPAAGERGAEQHERGPNNDKQELI